MDTTPSLSNLPRPPKVPGLPVLGQSLGFLRDTSGLLDKLYRTHGPVFRIRAGWNDFTVIAGKEGRDFLLEGAERHLTREAFFRPVGEQLGSSDFVLGVSGDKHTRLRRVLSTAYSRQVASPFVPQLLDIARDAVRGWEGERGTRVMPAIHRLAYALYTRVMAGADLSAQYRDFALLVETNMTVGGRTMPAIAYKNPLYQRARKRILEDMWARVQTARREGPRDPARPTIIDTLLQVKDRAGEGLNDDEVVCYAMYGIAGSCSYMGRLIAFWLYELLKHPAALERARAEVDGAFANGLRSATDLRGMEWLRATYHESMRFHPVSQGLPFIAAEDFAFRGMRIEKGEQVVFSQIPMFRDAPPYRAPERFEPERCMAPREEHRTGSAFHPFGMGQRSCTAQGLVEVMALTTMAALLHTHDVALTDPAYTLKMFAMPLPSPDLRFKVRVTPRSADARAAVDERRIVASFPGGENPAVNAILARARRRLVGPNEEIVRQGERADAFYVILQGEALVERTAPDGSRRFVATLSAGQFFGETGLLHGAPRNATVTAGGAGPTHLLVVSQEDFDALVRAEDLVEEEIAALARKRQVSTALSTALPRVNPEAMAAALPEFRVDTHAPGTVAIRQGDAPERFYLVCSGSAVVEVNGAAVATVEAGGFFGEIGLLLNAPRRATVRAGDAPLTVASTDRAGFHRLIASSGAAHADLALAMSRRVLALEGAAEA